MQPTCEMVVFLGLVWLQQQHCPYHRTSLLCFLAVSQTGPERVVPLYRAIIFKHIQRQIRIAATFISSIKNMTTLNNSGVHFPAFLHEIKDINTSCSIKRKSASLNIGAYKHSLGSKFELNVLLLCWELLQPHDWTNIYMEKQKKKKKNVYLFLVIN